MTPYDHPTREEPQMSDQPTGPDLTPDQRETLGTRALFVMLNSGQEPNSGDLAVAIVDAMASDLARMLADARAEAVADFVNRQAVEYRKHSAHAVYEDMILAVRDFGVSPESFYDEPEFFAALARAATPTDQP